MTASPVRSARRRSDQSKAILICLGLMAFQTAAQESPDLAPLVMPDVSQLKSGIRENIEQAFHAVKQRTGDPELDPIARAEAFGGLGMVLHAHNFRHEALVAYGNAHKLAPANQQWIYYMGFTYMELGKLDQAATYFAKALNSDAQDFLALVRLGQVLLDLDRPEEAKSALEKAIAIDRESTLALFALGQAEAALGDYQAAVDLLERALATQPEATTIHYPLGLAYRGLGDLDKAREFLGKRGEKSISFPDPYLGKLSGIVTTSTLQVVLSMARDPDSISDRDFEGYILSNLATKKGVVKYLQDALAYRQSQDDSSSTERARLCFAIATLQEAQGDPKGAVESYHLALEQHPSWIIALKKLGHLYAQAGRFDQEIAMYSLALEADDQRVDLLTDRANALLDLNRREAAIADLRRIIAIQPGHTLAAIKLATLLTERPGEAQAIYEGLLETPLTEEQQAFCHLELGKLLQSQGAFARAGAEFNATLKLRPQSAEALLNMAASLAFTDRYTDAVATYDRLIQIEPSHEVARLGQAAALILSGQYQQTAQALENAVQNIPASVALVHMQARFLAACPDQSLRDGSKAVQLAQRAVSASKNPITLETLAMALAQSGQFEPAIETQLQLIQQAQDSQRKGKLQANLELYQQGQSCCAESAAQVLLP